MAMASGTDRKVRMFWRWALGLGRVRGVPPVARTRWEYGMVEEVEVVTVEVGTEMEVTICGVGRRQRTLGVEGEPRPVRCGKGLAILTVPRWYSTPNSLNQ